MNCVSWNVGHLAWQEQRYFLFYAQGKPLILPHINELFAYGAPACTPELDDVRKAWNTITQVVDPWLDSVTTQTLQEHVVLNGKPSLYIFGSLLLRVIYHYWYHTGENLAIRQMLGHTNLPEFVGDIDTEAPYRAE
jgi:hypothetical protein